MFFGGAGVSTESGMKDYRSEDGLYNTVKQYGISPETILSHSFFMNKTDVFYDFYNNFFLKNSAEPNRAHYALATLERMGKLKAVITQNIDGLHQRAGSQTVFELHGSIARNHCISCNRYMELEEIKAFNGKIPKCPECGGIIKPDVVLYEEALDEKTVRGAIRAIASADMLIIGGTSLAVYPAASFIGYFSGSTTVLINKGETEYDSSADIVFRESIGEVLENAVSRL